MDQLFALGNVPDRSQRFDVRRRSVQRSGVAAQEIGPSTGGAGAEVERCREGGAGTISDVGSHAGETIKF